MAERSVLLLACVIGCSSPNPSITTSPPPIAGGSGSGSAAPAGRPTASVPLAIRLTSKVAANCGPDYLERHATSLSDLDGDGTIERPRIVRTQAGITVSLTQIPSLKDTATWTLQPATAYLELGTPQRRGTTRGDLWITTGHQVSPNHWTHALYHLDAGKLAEVSTDYEQWTMRIDVDGDGRVDPIGIGSRGASKGKVRALLATGQWLDLKVPTPSYVVGAPLGNAQEEAIDLDGNGVRELVLEYSNAVAIVEVPSLREVFRVKGKIYKPQLVRWGSAWVLAVRVDEQLRFYATDAKHAPLVAPQDAASYGEPKAVIGERLALSGVPWLFYERGNAKSVAHTGELVERIDARATPFGPTKLLATDAPSLATLGEAGTPMALVLLDPQTLATGRTVWTSPWSSGVQHDTNAWLVDLDRDGASEVLLEEIHRKAFHHGSSWNTMKLHLVDGAGRAIWDEPEARTDSWTHADGARGRMTQTRRDDTHVRAFDLGDGTMPLRIRSARDEYYVLPSGSKLTAVPVCLE